MIFNIINNPIFFGILVGLIMIFLTFINSKIIKDKDEGYSKYIKIFISSGLVSGGLKYLYDTKLENLKNMIGGNNLKKEFVDEKIIKDINTEILKNQVYTDMPDF